MRSHFPVSTTPGTTTSSLNCSSNLVGVNRGPRPASSRSRCSSRIRRPCTNALNATPASGGRRSSSTSSRAACIASRYCGQGRACARADVLLLELGERALEHLVAEGALGRRVPQLLERPGIEHARDEPAVGAGLVALKRGDPHLVVRQPRGQPAHARAPREGRGDRRPGRAVLERESAVEVALADDRGLRRDEPGHAAAGRLRRREQPPRLDPVGRRRQLAAVVVGEPAHERQRPGRAGARGVEAKQRLARARRARRQQVERARRACRVGGG